MGGPQNAATKVLIFAASFCFMFPLHSGEGKMDVVDAFNIVKTAPRVESRLVEEGGISSRIFYAFNLLRSQNNPNELFKKLNKESVTGAGKVYVLMWLFEHDKKEYTKAKLTVGQQVSFKILIGDLMYKLSPQEVFHKIETGELKTRLEMGLNHS
jgi:hypothetical protein